MSGKHALHHLPLRKFGFESVPAVLVDLPGMGTEHRTLSLGIATCLPLAENRRSGW
jgi:hypothetical protein